jgi:hypothetical protein
METQELKVESQEITNETNADSSNSEATSEIKNKKKLDKLIGLNQIIYFIYDQLTQSLKIFLFQKTY